MKHSGLRQFLKASTEANSIIPPAFVHTCIVLNRILLPPMLNAQGQIESGKYGFWNFFLSFTTFSDGNFGRVCSSFYLRQNIQYRFVGDDLNIFRFAFSISMHVKEGESFLYFRSNKEKPENNWIRFH